MSLSRFESAERRSAEEGLKILDELGSVTSMSLSTERLRLSETKPEYRAALADPDVLEALIAMQSQLGVPATAEPEPEPPTPDSEPAFDLASAFEAESIPVVEANPKLPPLHPTRRSHSPILRLP